MNGWNRFPTRIIVSCLNKKATCQNGWYEINDHGRSMQRPYVLNRLKARHCYFNLLLWVEVIYYAKYQFAHHVAARERDQ